MAAKRQFDLSSMMETISGLGETASTPTVQIQMIPLDDIISNPANFYKIDKMELKELADSIAIDGLQQYPVVMPHPQKAGKYLLISGHRRCAALRLLAEGPDKREDLRLVPCTVKHYKSEAMAELQLILANSTSRKLSNDEISKQAERLEILLYQLKEEGFEFPGRMRDQVARACQVSAPKLARLKVIREKLKAPEFLLLFEKDKLPERTAYALARLPEEFQRRLAGINPEPSGFAAEEVLKKYNAGWRWEPGLTCPDGKSCKRGDAFLRHDLENPFKMCGGQTCCLDCGQAKTAYYACDSCDRMCSKAQAIRKEGRDKEKARTEEQKQARIRDLQAATQVNAQRLLRAIDAAGLPDEARIQWNYYSDCTVEKIREYASGKFRDDESWHSVKFSPSDVEHAAKIVEILGCSADYLLGVTDELTPQAADPIREEAIPADVVEAPLEEVSTGPEMVRPVWLSGSPARTGPVLARFAAGDVTMVRVCWYDKLLKQYSFRAGPAISLDCTGWWPIPPIDTETSDEESVSKLDTTPEEVGPVGQ